MTDRFAGFFNADGFRRATFTLLGRSDHDAYEAVQSTELGCANRGLNIDADLDGTAHFGGPANQDQDGNYYIQGMDGYLWANGEFGTDGYLSANGYLWANGLTPPAPTSG